MPPNPAEHLGETKLFYDKMLQRTHETAQRLRQRLDEVTRRFPVQEGEAGCRKMRILVVEDNVDQAESLATVLRVWGFDAEVAYDAATALEMATRDHPDAILTDLGLPGMDGFELAERIAAEPDLSGTLMAAVSAYNDDDSRRRSKEVGLAEHFSKPTDLVKLHRFLDNRRDALVRLA